MQSSLYKKCQIIYNTKHVEEKRQSLRTDYRHYHARNNYQTLQWQENGRYTWFGPTKAKVSLIWLLARKQKTQEGGIK